MCPLALVECRHILEKETTNTNLRTTAGDGLGRRGEHVRQANLSAIVRELHLGGPLSRSDLVVRTGLTRSAIRGLVGLLAAARLVVEQPAMRFGTPGRPSPSVHLSPDGAVALGLEIAVDSLGVALVGLGGTVLDHARAGRPRAHSTPDAVVADLARLAAELLGRRASSRPLVGAGVAMAGVVRRSDGLVRLAPNLGWMDVPLAELLAGALALEVPVYVANEADLGALAELRRGAARGMDNVLFISGEVGVGAGIIVDGKPLSGIAGYGGEVGHLPVNPNGRACRCGAVGCWETEVGEEALLALAGYPRDAGAEGVGRLLNNARQGSPADLAALEQVGHWLGFGLAGLVNIFNPGLIVLGGLFGRIYPFVEATLQAELDKRGMPASRSLIRIVPGMLGADAPLLGAAELAFDPLLADPVSWAGRGPPRRPPKSSSLTRQQTIAEGLTRRILQ